ncbi:MAG: KTSC domain-containing protein [Patescibacteria group bacterium]|nr:KTSC domain-containing protein [Patescibacteria group bacterium]
MPTDMRHVFSSTIERIGYDPDTSELIVQWKDKKGRVSAYEGVAPDKAFQIMNAPSVGEALHRSIKPNHKHRYL